MSTKTIKQRIALVAVSALTAGLFSVVSAPASSANYNQAPGTNSPTSVAGVLHMATSTNATGAAARDISTAANNLSVGLLTTGDLVGNRWAGTTQTATLLSNGSLTVYTTGAASGASTMSAITVENGTIAGVTGADAISSGRTVAVNGGATVMSASITPTSGATTMTIRSYHANSSTYGGTADTAADATAIATATSAPSLGTLTGLITVTIASASAAGVMSTTKSGIYFAANGTGGLSEDATSGTWKTKSPTSQLANIDIDDAYGNAIAATTGLLQATATNGAIVAIRAAGTTTPGTASTAFYTGYSPDDTILVVNAPSFAPVSTTVTVTYNGVLVGTKAFTFTGPITNIAIGSALRIKELSGTPSAGSGVKGATIAFSDSAGNVIYPIASDSYYPTSGLLVSASSDRTPVLSVTPTSSTTGHIDWNCGSSASTDNAILTYVNNGGVVATSNSAKVSCADNPKTYTASWDKAVYTPGEVATLKVTFKDSKGFLANDNYDWSSGSFGSTSVSSGGGLFAVASSNADTSALGVASYRLLVGVTEGAYNAVVNVDALTSQEAVTAGFTVKSATTSVSNADVLKSIVALIASINKQIQALQKLILKR